MDNTHSPSGRSRWTFADFLSSYRYWALFFSSLLIAVAAQGLHAMLPMMSHRAGVTYQTIGMIYAGINGGWIVGAFIAFLIATRHGRAALIWPLAACAATASLFIPMPGLWASPLFMIFFGFIYGALQAVFPLALAIFLVGGRAGRVDFGYAFVLLSAVTLVAYFGPLGASMLAEAGTVPLSLAFLTCLVLSIILIAPARDLGFEGAPRQRHKPLAPRQRSSFLVAAILLAPPVLSILTFVGFYLVMPEILYTGDVPDSFYLMIFLLFVVCVGAFIYLAYWIYRIHGELAGAAASPHLLTPVAALLIGLLVPLGLPILVIVLGDLLNERARARGETRAVSIAWLAIFMLLMPPISIAMLQHAANRSYALPAAARPEAV